MEYTNQKKENLSKSIIHNLQGISFGQAQKLIRQGNVKVNGKRCKQNLSVEMGDIICVYQVQKSMPKVHILYKDDNIIIVNKPQGIECATRDKSSENTYSLEEILTEYNAQVVHRLDRLTEGIVILARSKEICKKFEYYFRTKKIEKYYKAGVWGIPKDEGVKTAYLKKIPEKSLVEISDMPKDDYKEIITEYKIEHTKDNKAILDINLHTGRTHQIRGYFSHIGHPIINDSKYGKTNRNFVCEYKGYFLTAYKLKFKLDDDMKYLNDIDIEITPSWIKYITQTTLE